MRHMIPTLILLLAACAPEAQQTLPTAAPTSAQPPTQEQLPDDEDELQLGEPGGLFSVTVTGDVETTFAGEGDYDCDDGSEILSSGTAGSGNLLRFVLPTRITAGEYTIGAEDSTVTADFVLLGNSYSTNTFGVLTLDDAPTALGEPVSGSFDMNFTNPDGDSVNAVGTFDLLATAVCP